MFIQKFKMFPGAFVSAWELFLCGSSLQKDSEKAAISWYN
jgi:hypothetical protein